MTQANRCVQSPSRSLLSDANLGAVKPGIPASWRGSHPTPRRPDIQPMSTLMRDRASCPSFAAVWTIVEPCDASRRTFSALNSLQQSSPRPEVAKVRDRPLRLILLVVARAKCKGTSRRSPRPRVRSTASRSGGENARRRHGPQGRARVFLEPVVESPAEPPLNGLLVDAAPKCRTAPAVGDTLALVESTVDI